MLPWIEVILKWFLYNMHTFQMKLRTKLSSIYNISNQKLGRNSIDLQKWKIRKIRNVLLSKLSWSRRLFCEMNEIKEGSC